MSYSRFEDALAKAVAERRIAGAVALVTDRDGAVYECPSSEHSAQLAA